MILKHGTIKVQYLDKVGRRDEAQNCFDKAKELELAEKIIYRQGFW